MCVYTCARKNTFMIVICKLLNIVYKVQIQKNIKFKFTPNSYLLHVCYMYALQTTNQLQTNKLVNIHVCMYAYIHVQ